MNAPLTRCVLPLALLAAALLAACGAEEVVVTETPARPVVVVPVAVVAFEERIEVSGELLAKNRAEVAAQVAGEITEILADEGDAVVEGQVVVKIDPERRQLELARARARVSEAAASVRDQLGDDRRIRALSDANIASAEQMDNVEAALDSARSRQRATEADLGVAERALRDASVVARFPGFIARRYVSRGEFVQPGQRLFELVSLNPIEVEFHLPEADASRVAIGQPIGVSVAPYPGEIFAAQVDVVSPTINRRTRTLRVKALIDNSDGRLRPGHFARAHVGVAQRTGVIMVPEEAVLRRVDGSVVFRVGDDHRVERLVVETGAIRNGQVEVRTLLAPGDTIVRRGHADLIDGSVIVERNIDGTLAATGGAS